ncbi:hypothetical protein AMECASPLE_018504 [Ameca splendens]|uniref:Uncharacterized protein n=1 Tax=Ameca splendens TaxID=208324 RepID=A0ABV0YQ35_9TELE
MVTMEELQTSTAQFQDLLAGQLLVVHFTNCLLWKTGRKKAVLERQEKKVGPISVYRRPYREQTCGRMVSGQMRPKQNFLAYMHNSMCGGITFLASGNIW